MTTPEISIIIVNYNTGEMLKDCLDSIRTSLTLPYEVVVVDNCSTDTSFEICRPFSEDPRFQLIPLGENTGFARGNNIACRHASAPILHFLNPDTKVSPALDEDYRKVIAAPRAAYVNTLVNRDGSVENEKMPIPTLRDLFWWDIDRKKARYWFKGASVILSREDFDAIGQWSEDYFMYAEDLDLFYCLWQAGVPVRRLDAEILHYGGGSSSRRWTSLERETVVQRSNRIFYRKYFSRTEYVLVKLYFILHKLFRHPSQVPMEIRAWIRSR